MTTIACWRDRTFTFEPERTALLVIDMQRDFLAEDSPFARAPGNATLREAMPAARRVLDAARGVVSTIVHTREGYAADGSDVSPAKAEMGYVGIPGPYGAVLVRGNRGHDFMDGFEPAEGEHVVDKAGFSAFFRTGLDDLLAARRVTHLLIAGVTTECCVHSTLRDAVERGYLCLTIADACAAGEREWHDASLTITQAEGDLFGWIADADAVAAALQVAAAAGA
jgi:nicotinamidase-related amidase